MSKFLTGLIIGIILVPLIIYLYFSTGMAPVATNASPMPFERMFARMALHAGMGKAASQTPPIAADEAAFVAGARNLQRALRRVPRTTANSADCDFKGAVSGGAEVDGG